MDIPVLAMNAEKPARILIHLEDWSELESSDTLKKLRLFCNKIESRREDYCTCQF